MPSESPRPGRAWRRLRARFRGLCVETRAERSVWVRLERAPSLSEIRELGGQLRCALERGREHLVLDLAKLGHLGPDAAKALATSLKECRARVRLVPPAAFVHPRTAVWLAIFSLYR
jgi:hypothetical protein